MVVLFRRAGCIESRDRDLVMTFVRYIRPEIQHVVRKLVQSLLGRSVRWLVSWVVLFEKVGGGAVGRRRNFSLERKKSRGEAYISPRF